MAGCGVVKAQGISWHRQGSEGWRAAARTLRLSKSLPESCSPEGRRSGPLLCVAERESLRVRE